MAICLSVSRVLTLTFSSSPVLRPAAEGWGNSVRHRNGKQTAAHERHWHRKCIWTTSLFCLLSSLHACAICDTSACKGIGKVKPMQQRSSAKFKIWGNNYPPWRHADSQRKKSKPVLRP
jgi:hypothetical protein